MMTLRSLGCWLLALTAVPGLAWSADPAASVVMLVGHAVAQSADGTVRTLSKGAVVAPGETVSTDRDSYVNLRFADGGFFLLRPLTKLQIEQFALSAADAAQVAAAERPAAAPPTRPPPVGTSSRALFRMLRGGFRAVSGLIGKARSSEYAVITPVATIGIRGTDFYAVRCSVECRGDSATAGLPADALSGDSIVYGGILGEITLSLDGNVISVLGPGKNGLLTSGGKFYLLPAKPAFIASDPYIGQDAKSPTSCL